MSPFHFSPFVSSAHLWKIQKLQFLCIFQNSIWTSIQFLVSRHFQHFLPSSISSLPLVPPSVAILVKNNPIIHICFCLYITPGKVVGYFPAFLFDRFYIEFLIDFFCLRIEKLSIKSERGRFSTMKT